MITAPFKNSYLNYTYYQNFCQGFTHKHLKQHKNPFYTAMQFAGTLEDHVAEIDRQVEELLDRLLKQMAQREGVTEQLKARKPMEWTRQMNNIRNRAVG